MKRTHSILLAAVAALAVLPVVALDAPTPSQLKFVEYIESNSDRLAYIDTGYVPNANTEIEMDFAFVPTPTNLLVKTYVFGVYGQSGMRFQFSYGPDNCLFGFGPDSNWDNAVTGFPYNTERHVVKYVHNVGFFFDGTKVVPKAGVDLITWGGQWGNNGTAEQNLYLGACNGNGSVNSNYIGPLRIYSCKIWDNGELVRNFMPAETDSSKAVLYDTVHRKIHFNANGNNGKFLAGGEEVVVNDYRKANYIEANQTAYINTGYTPNADTELEMTFSFTTNLETKTYLFGSYGESGEGRFMMSYGPDTTGCFLGYGEAYTNSYVLPQDNYYDTNRHVVKYVPGSGNGFYFDGERINPPNTNLTTWKGTGAKLFLGQVNPNGGDLNPTNLAPIRIYSCKIWENGTPKRNLVPKQRVLDGKNGLKQVSFAFLDVLSQRVKIGGEGGSGGKNSLAFFAFAFTEQLLVPFDKEGQFGIIGHHQFDFFAVFVQHIA